jgi:hypothetical protein
MALRTHKQPSGSHKKRVCWSRWIEVSRCRKYMRTHLLYYRHWIKRLGRIRLSNVLNGRMALRTHNMPSGCLKKRLWRSRWSDVSKCRWAIWTHLLNHRIWKMWLGYIRLYDVLSRRMDMRSEKTTKNIKKRLRVVNETMFLGVARRNHEKTLWWNRWRNISRCR